MELSEYVEAGRGFLVLHQDFEMAERAFRMALGMDADCAPALAGLAQILAKRDGEYAEAIEMYDRAIAAEPDNPEFLMLRSASYSDSGKHVEALRDIQAALTVCPPIPDMRRALEGIEARIRRQMGAGG